MKRMQLFLIIFADILLKFRHKGDAKIATQVSGRDPVSPDLCKLEILKRSPCQFESWQCFGNAAWQVS